MWHYIARRMGISVVLLAGVGCLVFLVMHIIPGDVVAILFADSHATEAQMEAVRRAIGLDQPLMVQLIEWLRNLGHLNLGYSIINGRPVLSDLWFRLPRTLELMVSSAAIGWAIGLPIGVLSARWRNSALDLVSTVAALTSLSTPVFVFATLLILVFGLHLRWFPTGGYVSFSVDPWGHLRQLFLPSLSLGIWMSGTIIRMTRGSLLEVLGQNYITTARSKGLGERSVLSRHALRNAVIPVVTMSGMQMAAVFGGSVIVEHIFNWPGISSWLILAINRRDYPVVEGTMLFVAAAFLLANLIVDIANACIDPRMR